MRWGGIDFYARVWTCPAERMKTGEANMVPLSDEMLAIIEPLKAMQSEYVFEGQKRHRPLSNMPDKHINLPKLRNKFLGLVSLVRHL